ncbi:MAG: 3-keto-5-aminohexanoate cleavage protein [Alphaproteobacteria bacterium]
MNKTIITCAVCGAETTREQNPNLPITPDEIAAAALEARKAGAAILHLHVRKNDGSPTQDIEVFKEAIKKIRDLTDLVIEVTTGGAVGMSLEERLMPLKLKPEMASLDCGTVNFGDDYIINTMPMMRDAAKEMNKYEVRPTIECFDISHIDASKILIREGLIEAPLHYGLVFNVPSAVRYDAETLSFFVKRLPEGANWTAVGVGGKAALEASVGALAMGGNIRVGFEDNVYMTKGVLAQSNAELVERAAKMITACGNLVATPDDVRTMFKIKNNI